MAKTLTKKELKAPDAFIAYSAKVGIFIGRHKKTLSILIGILLAAAVIFMAWSAFRTSKESSATEALFPAESKVSTALDTLKTGEPVVLGDYVTRLKEYSGTQAALVSAMTVVGKLQAKEGTEELQKEILSSVSYTPRKSNILYGLSRLTYGNVALKNNDIDEAQKYFKEVADLATQKPLHPSALIHLGGIAEAKGDLSGARDFYRRVIQEFPDTEAQRAAEKLIIHLDLLSEPSKG